MAGGSRPVGENCGLSPHRGWALFAAAFLAYAALAVATGDYLSETDSDARFLGARYALAHPAWLLDPWHKPVLTTLMAGVILAGGGAVGVKLVQAVLAALTLVLIRAAARRFGARERETLLAVGLAGLAPFWVRGVVSALTETSCALLLAAALYSWSRKWLVLTALAASFAFLARFDAIFFWIVWAPFLLRKRSLGGLACLAAGPVLWHLAGWAAIGDAAYLLTHQPHPWGASHSATARGGPSSRSCRSWRERSSSRRWRGSCVRRASPSPCARRWSRGTRSSGPPASSVRGDCRATSSRCSPPSPSARPSGSRSCAVASDWRSSWSPCSPRSSWPPTARTASGACGSSRRPAAS